jgi:hypothetical protein
MSPPRRRSWQERSAARFGWRGVYLQAIGFAWLLVGVAVLFAPTEAHAWVLFDFAPPWLRAAAWAGSGVAAVVVGRRGPHQDDSLGHVALYLVPAARAASYGVSWVAWATSSIAHSLVHADVEVVGWQPALFPAVVWVAFIAMLSITARWPNPVPLPHPPPASSEPNGYGS